MTYQVQRAALRQLRSAGYRRRGGSSRCGNGPVRSLSSGFLLGVRAEHSAYLRIPDASSRRLTEATPYGYRCPCAYAAPAPGRLPPIRRRWLVLVVLILFGIVAWIIWSQYTSSQTTRPNYQSSRVTQGTLRTTIAATGPIANPTSVPVSFKNAGKLIEVNISIGDRVRAGQVLARQDPADLETALRRRKRRISRRWQPSGRCSKAPPLRSLGRPTRP